VTTCAIGLGSNLGDSLAILQQALQVLNALEGVGVKVRSQLYQTAPIGPPQPDYLNCCALLHTRLTPAALLVQLLVVEQHFGRVRQERWGPRLLDLDLLLFGSDVIQTPELVVPHPRMHERAFVLIPLRDIAADWQHPILGQTIAELAEAVDPSGIQRVLADHGPFDKVTPTLY
jgi:2-amino-4-hydroxy-6-hydroxymethyldihydropteridine diphosphokinase